MLKLCETQEGVDGNNSIHITGLEVSVLWTAETSDEHVSVPCVVRWLPVQELDPVSKKGKR